MNDLGRKIFIEITFSIKYCPKILKKQTSVFFAFSNNFFLFMQIF